MNENHRENDIPLRTLREFKEKIFSFGRVAKITKDDIGGECKFIADPFVCYDASAKLWVLFVEVAAPARRQNIGVLQSPDLRKWKFYGDAIKGSRESFPHIVQHDDCYLMTPCIEATPAPGLVAIYKAKTLLGRWELANQFVLKKLVNDRVLIPCLQNNRCYLLYGTRSRRGPALEYIEVKLNAADASISIGKSKVLLRSKLNNYLQNRLFGNPRLTMRPAGSLIPIGNGYILPIQGTYTGKYGECLAFAYIWAGKNSFKITGIDFLSAKSFCPNWSACHHFSFFRHKKQEVFAVDGHSGSSDWEVQIFSNNQLHHPPPSIKGSDI